MNDGQKLDLSSLRKVLGSLTSALELTRSEPFRSLDDAWQKTLVAGVLQNFEFSFELSWKMLKRQLEIDLPNPAELDSMSYRELIRFGCERGLLDDPEAWFDYRLLRNITSHTYNEDKARRVYEGTSTFLQSGQFLLQKLEERNRG